jgi:hypothetical protein
LTTQTKSVIKDLVGSTSSDSENAQTDLAFKQYWISTKLPECPFVAEKPLLMSKSHRDTSDTGNSLQGKRLVKHNHLATVNKQQAAKYRYFEEQLSHQIYGGYTKH